MPNYDTATILKTFIITAFLTMIILITLNMGDFTYNDITYNLL
jgi:hypothetical protein